MALEMPSRRAAHTEPRPVRRERNARGEGGRLRHELIDAASELMAEHGSAEAATIRAVARRAGVSAPSVYLHFADREALVQAVIEQRFRDLLAAVQAASAAAGPDAAPAERLRRGCGAYVRYGLENPGHYRVLFDTPTDPYADPTDEAADDAFGALVAGVAACQEAGAARAGDPYDLASLVWSSMHGLVMLRIVFAHFEWPDVQEQLEALLVALVGIPPEAP